MATTFGHSRKINILNSKVQKDLDISNIREFNKPDTSDLDEFETLSVLAMESYRSPLHKFTLNGINYKEVFVSEQSCNGNDTFLYIDSIEDDGTLEEYSNNFFIEHHEEGIQCSNCNHYHTKEYFNPEKLVCVDCGTSL